MMEQLYEAVDRNLPEADSVLDFFNRYVTDLDMEEKFYAAICDTRMAAIRAGANAAMKLSSGMR